MERIHLLAAEIFSFGYASYKDHLGINEQFDISMPEDAKTLETAINEEWPIEKVMQELEISEEVAIQALQAASEALDIVDSKTPTESFRKSVEYSIRYALEEGINNEEDLMKLVEQISHKTADLALLLDIEEQKLSHYLEELRGAPLNDELSYEY